MWGAVLSLEEGIFFHLPFFVCLSKGVDLRVTMLAASYRQALRQARIRRALMDQDVVVHSGSNAVRPVQEPPPPPPYVNLSLWLWLWLWLSRLPSD